jgi:hypothetical protein
MNEIMLVVCAINQDYDNLEYTYGTYTDTVEYLKEKYKECSELGYDMFELDELGFHAQFRCPIEKLIKSVTYWAIFTEVYPPNIWKLEQGD